jgi:hypothetical protein
VPVETVKTEYRDRVEKQRDSIYFADTIRIVEKGDTTIIYKDRYRYLYKDRFLTDTVIKRDSIPVPYPVEVVKHKVPGIMWWIILVLFALSLPFIFKIIRFFRGKI